VQSIVLVLTTKQQQRGNNRKYTMTNPGTNKLALVKSHKQSKT